MIKWISYIIYILKSHTRRKRRRERINKFLKTLNLLPSEKERVMYSQRQVSRVEVCSLYLYVYLGGATLTSQGGQADFLDEAEIWKLRVSMH